MRAGRPVRGAGISARYEAGTEPKAAVVVSKKVARGAVERARLRRLVYRSLPSPLPLVHMVLFVQSANIEPEAVIQICSRLS